MSDDSHTLPSYDVAIAGLLIVAQAALHTENESVLRGVRREFDGHEMDLLDARELTFRTAELAVEVGINLADVEASARQQVESGDRREP
jgi:hypothetical protein